MATQNDVARHLGVTPKYVGDLIADGTFEKKPRGQYDIDECRNAYIKRLRENAAGRAASGELDLVAERARLAKEQADAKEMDNAIGRGDLVYIEDVAKQFENMLTKVRTKLLALPTKIAPECHASATMLEVQSLIEAGIVEALHELVGYDQAQAGEEARD